MKSVPIRNFSGPHFPAFGMNMDQKNSEYRHFSRKNSELQIQALLQIQIQTLQLLITLLETILNVFNTMVSMKQTYPAVLN